MAARLHSEPLADVARDLRQGSRDLRTYLADLDGRIESIDDEIHAFVPEPERAGRVRREAARLEEAFPAPDDRAPLYGVPVGIKDIFHVRGLPTRANSELPPGVLAGPEAAAVTRLRAAGALVIGKTVTTEFAYADPGPTRNPHNTDHTPGGSSSGSAAGVAAGLFPLALGSQTGGSVLRPAAYCGIVGVKPTYDRTPTDGVIPLAKSLDHVGFFTQDVAGARLAASVLCDGWDTTAEPAGRPVLGVPDDAYLEQADDVGRRLFDRHVDALEDAGYEVRRTSLFADAEGIATRHQRLMAAEAALAHHEWYEAYGDRYGERIAAFVEDGRGVSIGELAEARAGQDALRQEVEDTMAEEGIDCWIAPAAPGPAPEGIDSTGSSIMNRFWTYVGLPAVSLPAGDHDGLPVGLQCVAGHLEGERLLGWADELWTALPG